MQFFFGRKAFDAEQALYANAALQPIMPRRLAYYANDDGYLKAPNGLVYPPVIAIERGESLNEFAQHCARDDAGMTMLHALEHIVRRVAVLHDARLVHRDLKPENILRRPHEHSWVLIDFGCVASDGAPRAVLLLSLSMLTRTHRRRCVACDAAPL